MTRMGIGAAAALIAGLCSLTTLAACRREAPAREEPQETVVPVGVVAAQSAGIRAVVRASGVVAPADGAEFLAVAPEPARIVEIMKVQGDAVRAGDALVRFDLPGAAQDVARLAADLAAAQAQLENARINQGRVRDFVERGLVPRRDLDNADRELADAQAAADRVRTAHASATTAAGRAVVRAPFDGIVAARHHQPGDLVASTSSDPVLRIVDPKRLDVIAFVAQADVSRVVPGATARVAGPAGSMPINLAVDRRLADRVGPDDTMPFRLLFRESTTLAVDTRVELDIDAEERSNVVLVPAEAIVGEGAQRIVFVAAGDRAMRRAVTTGIEDDQRVEIRSGIQAGELVITRGQIGLQDGALISVAR